jgi:hypothetical protein
MNNPGATTVPVRLDLIDDLEQSVDHLSQLLPNRPDLTWLRDVTAEIAACRGPRPDAYDLAGQAAADHLRRNGGFPG